MVVWALRPSGGVDAHQPTRQQIVSDTPQDEALPRPVPRSQRERTRRAADEGEPRAPGAGEPADTPKPTPERSPRRERGPRIVEDSRPEPTYFAQVAVVTGAATIRAERDDRPREIKPGLRIEPGDTLATQADGELRIAFADGSSLELSEHTEMTLGEAAAETKRPRRSRPRDPHRPRTTRR